MKKIFVFLVLSLVLLIPTTVFAEDNSDEYVIESYDVNIVVNENNTFQITENIGVYFNIYKHGIYRNIPLTNEIVREDGKGATRKAEISNISVNANFETYNESGDKVIKIGDPYYTIVGENSYSISYLYDIGKDALNDKDELYFNIIGDEWDTTIDNVTFKIIMPKEFDDSTLGFSVGEYGAVGYDENLTYQVDGNVITGSYAGTLYPGWGLTVRMELPDGYFVGANSLVSIVTILSIILPIIFVILSFLIWVIFGRDKKVIETVEFYPPEGYNSARVGFLYNGKASNEDVVSLLIYLANKGYIEIEDEKRKYVIRKIKDYDGDNEEESLFMSGLFRSKNEVRPKDLKNKFYLTVQSVISTLDNKESRKAIFESKFPIKRFLVVLMMIATMLLITVKPVNDYYGNEFSFTLMGTLFPLVGMFWLFVGLFDNKKKLGSKIGGIIAGILFVVIPFFVFVYEPVMVDSLYLTGYLIGIICTVIMSFFYYIMPKRTDFGNDMLGKIGGFKNFLKMAEKPKLEAMVYG